MSDINYRDWDEQPTKSLFIRTYTNLNMTTAASRFILECSDQIKIGAGYSMSFTSSTFDGTVQPFINGAPSSSLLPKRVMEFPGNASSITFINIDFQHNGSISELDVIIHLTENDFPSVGIMDRWRSPWTRLDNSSGQALEMYTQLATWLHLKLPSERMPQAATARNPEGRDVGIHLLPRPRQERPEDSHLVPSREYLVKMKVARDSRGGEERRPAKRRRTSLEE